MSIYYKTSSRVALQEVLRINVLSPDRVLAIYVLVYNHISTFLNQIKSMTLLLYGPS